MSSKRPVPQRPRNLESADNHLAITAYGLQSVIGNRDYALFGAVAALMSSSSANPTQQVPSLIHENSFDPALMAAIPEYEGIEPNIRMLLSLQNALTEPFEYLLEKKCHDKKHLLLIALPASVFVRSDSIDTVGWQEAIKEDFSEFTDLVFHFFKADANVTKHLQSACASVVDGKVNSVLFAGCDSLLDPQTCEELFNQKRLRSTTIHDGVVPGEAAACVVIQQVNSTAKQPPLAILAASSYSPEPNSGKAHTSNMTGLRQVIQNVTQKAQQTPDNIECVVRNSSEQQYAYEWYQTTQSLWPNTLPEQQRIAYQTGELNEPPKLEPRTMPEELFTSISLGEVGAATIPLSLVLGCARFDFHYPTVKNCLIMEANEFLYRGGILLENPTAKPPQKPRQ